MFTASLIGFVLGLVGSMPVVGPISILVFTRGVENRPRSGIAIAMGAAIGESGYASLAFWGMSELLARHAWIEPATRAVGAVLLTGLGLWIALRGGRLPGELATAATEMGLRRSVLLGFAITALNPALVATWTLALTTTASIFDASAYAPGHVLPFALGVWLGIVAWFAFLLSFLGRFRGRFRPETLARVIRTLGVVLTMVGLVFAWRFLSYVGSGA